MKSHVKSLNRFWTVKTTRSHDDKFSIRYAIRHSGKAPINRFVVYMNGRTEWIEKNMEIPDWLDLPDDCAFLTMDHRGQGSSGGKRAYVRSYDDYVLDAKRVLDEAASGKPYVLLAHSMGGLISLYGTLTGAFKPHALALCAPLLRIPSTPLPPVLAKPVARVLTAFGCAQKRSGAGRYDKAEFANNKLTHDPDEYQVVCASPYYVPSATFGWVDATFKALDVIFDDATITKLPAPTLILNASEDRVVNSDGQYDWVKKAAHICKVDVQILSVHGSRHELFSELPVYRDQAIAAIKTWFSTFLS